MISLLLANLYGPGDHLEAERSHALTALLRRFFEAVRDGQDEVAVWGSGEPIREWLYVEDAAEALVVAAERVDSVEPFNVGTGVGLSIRELAETIARAVGFTGRIRYDRSFPDGAPFKTLCVERFTTATGWRARTPLDEGLAHSLEWLRHRL